MSFVLTGISRILLCQKMRPRDSKARTGRTHAVLERRALAVRTLILKTKFEAGGVNRHHLFRHDDTRACGRRRNETLHAIQPDALRRGACRTIECYAKREIGLWRL